MDKYRDMTPRGAYTSPRPDGVTDEEADALKREALHTLSQRSLRRRSGWCTTGDVDVPGWVLGELFDAKLISHRKRDGAAPNEWHY